MHLLLLLCYILPESILLRLGLLYLYNRNTMWWCSTEHLFPTSDRVTLSWWVEIGHGRRIYSVEFGKHFKSEFYFLLNKLKNTYQNSIVNIHKNCLENKNIKLCLLPEDLKTLWSTHCDHKKDDSIIVLIFSEIYRLGITFNI